MNYLPWILAFFILAYYIWNRTEVRDRFWRWITEKSPYFKVATDISLTSKGAQKYLNQALLEKYLALKAEYERLMERYSQLEGAIKA